MYYLLLVISNSHELKFYFWNMKFIQSTIRKMTTVDLACKWWIRNDLDSNINIQINTRINNFTFTFYSSSVKIPYRKGYFLWKKYCCKGAISSIQGLAERSMWNAWDSGAKRILFVYGVKVIWNRILFPFVRALILFFICCQQGKLSVRPICFNERRWSRWNNILYKLWKSQGTRDCT